VNDLLQRYLDGTLAFEDLPVSQQRDAERWDAWLATMHRRPRGTLPAAVEERILAAVHAAAAARADEPMPDPAPVRTRRGRRHLALRLGAGAAALLAGIALAGRGWQAWIGNGGLATGSADGTVLVEFQFVAPEARSVALAGDFSDWEPVLSLTRPGPDGRWSGRLPMRPGVHHYMFVVDGSRWVTDPLAERHVDDGFGNRNAVVAVIPPTRGS
jgi:hypothetical protein